MTHLTCRRRLLALILALAMLSALALEGVAYPLTETESDLQDQTTAETGEATEEETQTTEPETGDSATGLPQTSETDVESPEEETPEIDTDTDVPQSPEAETPEENDEGLQTEPVEDAESISEIGEPDDELYTQGTQEQETVYVLHVAQTQSLSLEYDDRYSFSSLADGYVILSLQTDEVLSYQVSAGEKTSKLDSAVLTQNGDSDTDVIASGVGSATVLLVARDELEQGQAALEGISVWQSAETDGETGPVEVQVDVIQVNVTVQPATLTVMFLAGQSNMEGICTTSLQGQGVNSVLCPDGEVYSTYAPSSSGMGKQIAGISTSQYTENPKELVAGSLTSNISQAGTKLAYAIDALTSQGDGKAGMDAALAYEWNRLTGEKVWVINAAYSGSGIASWAQGGACYTKALGVFEAAIQTLEAEVSAGHYTEGERLLFWLQGEADRNMSAEYYLTNFQSMQNGFVENCGVDYFGLIPPRSSQGSYTNSDDIYMNGPRLAQYYMGNSSSSQYAKVYVVSNVNEQWISDEGVSNYFNAAYPSGQLTYPLRSSSTLSGLPQTVDSVHADIHYAQVAHNENGLTAARNLYYIVKNCMPSTTVTVTWRDDMGQAITNGLSLSMGSSMTVVPVVEPLYYSKRISIQTSSSALTYTEKSGTLQCNSAATAYLLAKDASGQQVSSLSVTVQELASPTLGNIANQTGSIYLNWYAVSGATGYVVYRKTSGQSWSQIATVTTTNYTDTQVSEGVTYTYTVRAYQGSQLSSYNSTGLSITYLSPTQLTVSGTPGNVQLSWSQIDLADSYKIYRREQNGSWQILEVVTSSVLSYTDTTALSGIQYDYAVVGLLQGRQSGYTAVSWTGLGTPELVSVQCVETGIRVSWKQVSGATGYLLYRKTSGTQWTRIAQLSGIANCYYIDSDVSNGQVYTYTLKAVSGSLLSDYDHTGAYTTYIQTPEVTALQNTGSGASLTWKQVPGSTSYLVYRKSGSGSWTRLATVTGTSYTDTSALSSGTTYLYTVRAAVDGTLSGYCTAGYSLLHLDMPKISAAANTAQGNQITWNSVSGATSYLVYRKSGSSSWTRLGTVTGTSYTDTAVQVGTAYIYTVRAAYGTTWSDYDHTGTTVYYMATPQVTSAIAQSGGITVQWNKVSGASSYLVYRKSGNSSWTRLGIVTGTSYTDTTALQSGTTYLYTVRASAGGVLSIYDSAGYACYYLQQPEISALSNTSQGLCLTWNSVSGATSYLVYRKSGSSSWTRLGTVTGTSYTDTAVQVGTAYTYTVRAAYGTTWSDYDHTGTTAYRLAMPQVTSAIAQSGGITVQWDEVSGASSYLVYRKSGNSGWTRLGIVTGTSYTDTTALQSGTTYLYTVRASAGGVLSTYDSAGYACYYLQQPEISALSNTSQGICLTWNSVSGATSYLVYRKSGSSSWTRLGTVTGTSYTDTTAQAGTAYTYTVRAARGSDWSDYNHTGKSVYRVTTPVLTSAQIQSDGIVLQWEPVSGATSYLIYRKRGDSEWVRVATVTSDTTYLDASADLSAIYTYTVRALRGSTLSDYDHTGVTAGTQ